MAQYRQIHTKIWKDGWFLDLEPPHKLLFIYLFSNERANLLGLYELPFRVIVFESGLSENDVMAGLSIFEQHEKAFYQDGWVWVRSLLHYNARNTASPKIQTHILDALSQVPDIPIKARMMAYYQATIPYIYGMIPNPTEQEQEQDTRTENKSMNRNNNRDGIAADAASAAVVFSLLSGFGVDVRPDVEREFGNLDPAYVKGWIDYVESRQPKPTRPAGYLISCLRSGTDPPRGKGTDDGDWRRFLDSEFADFME